MGLQVSSGAYGHYLSTLQYRLDAVPLYVADPEVLHALRGPALHPVLAHFAQRRASSDFNPLQLLQQRSPAELAQCARLCASERKGSDSRSEGEVAAALNGRLQQLREYAWLLLGMPFSGSGLHTEPQDSTVVVCSRSLCGGL